MNSPVNITDTDSAAALPTIGKDVIELLSTAMYVDPLTIYREYIQNSADAIDEARRAGRNAGRIDIIIDPLTRSVTIRDDGTGIPASQFGAVLSALGASRKRGMGARGFRGIGRLSGLAYARSVTFRSRASGEDRVSELRWDCQQLRAALREPDDRRELPELIDAVTDRHEFAEAGPAFFEVALDGIARIGDDRLMAAGAVADYLAQIAPIPFSPAFSAGDEIKNRLQAAVGLAELDIRINGGEPLNRPFEDIIPVNGGRPLRLAGVSFIEVPTVDGELGAVGWISHHDYEGAVHPSTRVRGLRVRVGDIQIGDSGVLADIYPEQRFDAWTVGELHILDSRIVPNGRRDDFERNIHLGNLKNHLSPLGREVAQRCRTSSRDRKRLRDLDLEQTTVLEGLSVLRQGSLGPQERDRLALSMELSLMRADKLAGAPELVDAQRTDAQAAISNLRAELEALVGDEAVVTSPLDRLPAERRAFYEEMFALIYDCAQNRSAAKSLVDRIIAKVV